MAQVRKAGTVSVAKFVSPVAADFPGSGLQAATYILSLKLRNSPHLWNELILAHVFADFMSFGKPDIQVETIFRDLLSGLWVKCTVERSYIALKPHLGLSTKNVDYFEKYLSHLSIGNFESLNRLTRVPHVQVKKVLERTIGDVYRMGQAVQHIPKLKAVGINPKSLMAESLRQSKSKWQSKVNVKGYNSRIMPNHYKQVDCGFREDDTMLRKMSQKRHLLHYAIALYKLEQRPGIWWQYTAEADKNLIRYLRHAARVYIWFSKNEIDFGLQDGTLKAAAAVYSRLQSG